MLKKTAVIAVIKKFNNKSEKGKRKAIKEKGKTAHLILNLKKSIINQKVLNKNLKRRKNLNTNQAVIVRKI